MKLYSIFVHTFLFLLLSTALSAEDKLDGLLKERKELYKQFEFYESQKSSFWGTKSKKDLKNIIATLKSIILKDTEIIEQINIQNSKKNTKVISRNQIYQEWANELEGENNRLKILLNKTTFDYNKMLEENKQSKNVVSRNNTVIFILSFIICCLVFYLVKLKQALKVQHQEKKEGYLGISVSNYKKTGS